jgi:hypothetical protein
MLLESTLSEFLDEFMTPAVMAISMGDEYRISDCDILKVLTISLHSGKKSDVVHSNELHRE